VSLFHTSASLRIRSNGHQHQNILEVVGDHNDPIILETIFLSRN
jgi:hypothetical protein